MAKWLQYGSTKAYKKEQNVPQFLPLFQEQSVGPYVYRCKLCKQVWLH